MDILLIVLAAICLFLGLVGCFLPVLPGPPLAYVGLLLAHWADKVQFSVSQLLFFGFLVVVVQVLDYVAPILGAKYGGGSKWGNWGCAIGTVIGIFLFMPWGIFFGPLLGAFIGELLSGKALRVAFKAGIGAFIGFQISVILKVLLCVFFIGCLIKGLIG
ncbi:DUF456 domain-containing protein [Parabacteroides sp. AM08-6]|uniref:DUF456 domain-containing protein n=1 Tax=Parabacteroides sp. AM08-6 TaxID=2292053 RepID=UPI000F009FFE|nr:DUF456 domain-containing protein [Parabacteroides sp. AM08-6]RHJ83214.1 DUF456 domain-containing protein [Parabacteroides sp. AM08-6]